MFSYDDSHNGINAGAWIEVDLDAISYNYDTVRSIIGDETRICSVIKADAYGHGVYEVARLLERKGVDCFAVAVLDEGIELRRSGITKPILVLGPLMPEQTAYILRYNLTQTIVSLDMAKELSREALLQNRTVKVHIKIDTGMGRIGVFYEDAAEFVKEVRNLPNIEIEGIFTHYATSDSEDKSYVMEQWENFNQVLNDLKAEGIRIPISHVATSATVIDQPFMKLDMVRTGLMLYGIYPRANMREKVELKPALTLKAKVSYIKEMKKRQSISYSRRYFAEVGEKIATLPLGYNDGFRRLFTNNGEVLIQGKRCPMIGTVCMDHIMINVSQLDEVNEFEEAILIGKQGDEEISVDELANRISTINYEVISGLGKRLPRIYRRNGTMVAVRNLLGYHTSTILDSDREGMPSSVEEKIATRAAAGSPRAEISRFKELVRS
jgi:alanine racemase